MVASKNEEGKPLSNQRPTILGVTITFLIFAIVSVLLRLYVRIKLMKSPWWDDLLVVLAMVAVSIGTIFVCLCTDHGLGEHFNALPDLEIAEYLFHFYIANGFYNLATSLIKLSLLFQYLRVFNTDTTQNYHTIRKLCYLLILLISAWGFAYTFLAFFPCFPIQAYWDWRIENATRYAYGARERKQFVAAYESHGALNMVFDIAVFLMPVSMIWKKGRERREYVAIGGLLCLGVLIITISSWRLATIVTHQAGWSPRLDFTWYAPISLLLSCLEVDTAILAASMPIFWPAMLKVIEAIIVTKEIHITTELRRSRNNNTRSRNRSRHKYGRSASREGRLADARIPSGRWTRDGEDKDCSGVEEVELETGSVHSEAELNRKRSAGEEHYRDSYVAERVVPLEDRSSSRAAGVEVRGNGPGGRW